MNVFRNNRRNKVNKKRRKVKFDSKRLMLIALLMMMTTLAWFTYSRVLDLGERIHINAWNIEFYKVTEFGENGEILNEEKINNDLEINLTDLYPGMEEKIDYVRIVNNGETDAEISASFTGKLTILGKEYEIVDNVANATTDYFIVLETINSEGDNISTLRFIDETQLDRDGNRRFPFKIAIEYTTLLDPKHKIVSVANITNTNTNTNTAIENVVANAVVNNTVAVLPQELHNEGYLKITTSWDEETNPDEDVVNARNELDTKWGNDVASFIDGVKNGTITENIIPISFGLQINAILPQDIVSP